MAAPVKRITVEDLPADTVPGVSLYCPHCQEHYSATKGDYFWMPPDKPFRCGSEAHQGNNRPYLRLVRRHRAPLTDWSKDQTV